MIRKLYVLVLIPLLLSLLPISYATTTTTAPSEREITIIEKKVCFNISISDPITNKTTSKEICVVIDFHVKNAQPSNDTINVEFPVSIHVGNKTIVRKAVVPLKIEGEVTKIEVKSIENGLETSKNVIVVAPTTTQPQAIQTITQAKPTQTTVKPVNTMKPTSTVSQRTVTMVKTVTKTVGGAGISGEYVFAIVIVVIVIVVVFMFRKPRKEEKKYVEKEGVTIEDYEEALKLLKQKLEEKEQELEREKKSFKYKLMCPNCGNLVSPIITDDNRLLCPICNTEIGRIKEDGTLELKKKEPPPPPPS